MIRTIRASMGDAHYAVCAECKDESLMTSGVQHAERAINAAVPHGWEEITERDTSGRPMRLYYCSRCAVRHECRA